MCLEHKENKHVPYARTILECDMCVRRILRVVNLEDSMKNFHLKFCTQIKQCLIH